MGADEKTNEMVVVDIGKYKKIKRALKESEERYRMLFENVPLGVYRTTPEGKILDANPAYIKMLGYHSVAELAQIDLNAECRRMSYPRDDYKALMLQQGELKGFEVQCTRKDGSPITLRENAKLIRDDNGKALCYEGTIEDISEQKRMEELIHKRSQQMEILNKIILSGNKAESLNHLMEIIIDCVVELLNLEMACIYLIDAGGKSASLQVCRGLSKEFQADIPSCPVESSPFRDNFILGKSIYHIDFFRQFYGAKFLKRRGWSKMAALPLIEGERILGSLHVGSGQSGDFHDEDKAILEIIGKETGILISKLQAENALRESEAFYRQLVETSPEPIAIFSTKNEIQMTNRQFLRAVGFSSEDEVRGNTIDLYLQTDELPRFRESMASLLKEGRVGILEFNLIHREAGPTPFELSASLISDFVGNARSFILFGRDISARKLAEKELKENEQILRRTFEAIPDPAYLWLRLPNGKIILHLANNAARQVSGNRIQDYLGLELEEIYIDHPGIVSRVKEVLASGKSVNESIRFKERSGEEDKWLLMDYVKTAENNVLWITKDITERKLGDEKLLNYQEQLRSLSSALALTEERERRKIAVSLHDHIGQQLAFSKIKLDGLEKSSQDSRIVDAVDEIRQMLNRTIEDIRSLIFELSPPILYELGFDAALEWLAEHIQKRFDAGIDIHVESQIGRLEEDTQIVLFQIVRELLMNVAKHSLAKKAWVKVRRDSTSVQMEVGDDGRGFHAEELYPPSSASGFGFFSIRERIKHLGGILRVESKGQEGTRVFLKIPLTEA